jgi:hypothetical protein
MTEISDISVPGKCISGPIKNTDFRQCGRYPSRAATLKMQFLVRLRSPSGKSLIRFGQITKPDMAPHRSVIAQVCPYHVAENKPLTTRLDSGTKFVTKRTTSIAYVMIPFLLQKTLVLTVTYTLTHTLPKCLPSCIYRYASRIWSNSNTYSFSSFSLASD